MRERRREGGRERGREAGRERERDVFTDLKRDTYSHEIRRVNFRPTRVSLEHRGREGRECERESATARSSERCLHRS